MLFLTSFQKSYQLCNRLLLTAGDLRFAANLLFSSGSKHQKGMKTLEYYLDYKVCIIISSQVDVQSIKILRCLG